MNQIDIRPIFASDNLHLAGIIRKILTEFGANKPGTVFFDPTTDNLFQLFSERGSAYFVLEVDGKIGGGSGVYPTPGLPTGYCELVKLYILPELRRQGLGLMLMNKCFEQARDFGYKQVYLETMPELRHAIGLYEKAGFKYIAGPLGSSGHFGCDLWMIKDL